MTTKANGTQAQGTQAQGTQAQAQTQAQTLEQRKAALLAQAKERGAQAAEAPKARTKKEGYGVFVTVPEGHMVTVDYDKDGRELASWTLTATDLSWRMSFKTKRAALAWLDAQGDLAAQMAAARKLAGK